MSGVCSICHIHQLRGQVALHGSIHWTQTQNNLFVTRQQQQKTYICNQKIKIQYNICCADQETCIEINVDRYHAGHIVLVLPYPWEMKCAVSPSSFLRMRWYLMAGSICPVTGHTTPPPPWHFPSFSWVDIYPMLAQCRRRWTNNKVTFGKSLRYWAM